MKKAIFISAAMAVVFYGCKKDDSLTLKTQEGGVQLNQSTTTTNITNQGRTLITYTVHVFDPTKAGKTSLAGLSGATVDLIHNNGVQSSATTNANGFAMFTGLYEGYVNVDVNFATYTNVHYKARLFNKETTVTNSTDLTEHATTDIALWPLTSTVEGYVVGDYDNDGVASIDSAEDRTETITMVLNIVSTQPNMGIGTSGEIIDDYIVPSLFTATSTANSGKFTFANLPGTAASGIGVTATIGSYPKQFGVNAYSLTAQPFNAGWLQAGTTRYIGNYPLAKQKTVY